MLSELLRWPRTQPAASALVALVVLVLALLPNFLSSYWNQVLMIGFYTVMLGISWNLLAGYTGQFALCQHAMATIAGYVSAAVILTLGLPLLVGIAAGVVVAAALGYGLGWVTLGMRGIYFAISTWAFAETVRILLKVNYKITRGDMGLSVPYLFSTPDPYPYYYVFLAAALLTLLFSALLLRTKIGYRMRAIRDDQELAVAAGVDVVKWKRIVFAISSALAGLAGGLYGHSVGLLTPNQADFTQMAFVVIAVVLGGFRTIWGPVIGGLLVQGLAEYLRFLQEIRFVFFALLVILIVLLYPPGNMGGLQVLAAKLRSRPTSRPAAQTIPAPE
jgi:branched-chain amino acid transport system permease protein